MRVLCSLVLSLTCLAATEAAEPVASIGGQAPPRAARSVHLGWMAPEAAAFTVEMTIEQTTAGSYFMACGWSGGYFGLQEVRDGRKVAIFSVWDPVKGDDPKLVRPEDRVELLHADPEARIKRFGGEGTGGQCMIDFPWEVGQPVRFLVRAETHGTQAEKSAYSGWLQDPRTGGWRHLVTFRTRNAGRLLRGMYSFVEDFRRDGRSVGEVRRARFAGAWTRDAAGTWSPVTQARFTASRADWEARDNIDAGPASAGGYLLVTGGDTIRRHELGTPLPALTSPGLPPAGLPAAVWASSVGVTPR